MGQLDFERTHVLKKLEARSYIDFERLRNIQNPDHHPLFHVVSGEIEDWEKANKESYS
jgi:hypothetical protein